MKRLSSLFTVMLLSCSAQGFGIYSLFDRFLALKDSNYIVADVSYVNDLGERKLRLLFINTESQSAQKVDFPGISWMREFHQIRINELGINALIVSASLSESSTGGPAPAEQDQIWIVSLNGQQRTLLTDPGFYAGSWMVNQHVGTLVVHGYYDLNSNRKRDKADREVLQIYDLKTLKLIHRVEGF